MCNLSVLHASMPGLVVTWFKVFSFKDALRATVQSTLREEFWKLYGIGVHSLSFVRNFDRCWYLVVLPLKNRLDNHSSVFKDSNKRSPCTDIAARITRIQDSHYRIVDYNLWRSNVRGDGLNHLRFNMSLSDFKLTAFGPSTNLYQLCEWYSHLDSSSILFFLIVNDINNKHSFRVIEKWNDMKEKFENRENNEK